MESDGHRNCGIRFVWNVCRPDPEQAGPQSLDLRQGMEAKWEIAYRQSDDGSIFSIGSINMDGSRNWMDRFQWDLGTPSEPFRNFLDVSQKTK